MSGIEINLLRSFSGKKLIALLEMIKLECMWIVSLLNGEDHSQILTWKLRIFLVLIHSLPWNQVLVDKNTAPVLGRIFQQTNYTGFYQDLEHQCFSNLFGYCHIIFMNARKMMSVVFSVVILPRNQKLMCLNICLHTLKAGPPNSIMLSIIWTFLLMTGKFFYIRAPAMDLSFCTKSVLFSTPNFVSIAISSSPYHPQKGAN